MRKALALVALALPAVAGCQPQPAYDEQELKRLLGDAGHVEPATPRDCEAMILVARQYYRFGAGVEAPPLGADTFYRNCDWAKAGLAFPPMTRDHRFDWVSFSAVKTDDKGLHITTVRTRNGDGMMHARCDLHASGNSFQIARCTDRGASPQL
jgi:hypothetical protein